jgi:hypothetical protein
LIRNTWGLVVVGAALVLFGALLVKSSPVAMALVVMGAGAAILGIVLNLAEGQVKIGPSGVQFTLRQRVMQMSAERNLSKKETKMAVEDAKALERETRRQRQSEFLQEFRRPTTKTPPKPALPDETFGEWLTQMRDAGQLLAHRDVSQEDRRKAEAIVDDVAGDIVEEAPRRVRRKKRKTRAPRR